MFHQGNRVKRHLDKATGSKVARLMRHEMPGYDQKPRISVERPQLRTVLNMGSYILASEQFLQYGAKRGSAGFRQMIEEKLFPGRNLHGILLRPNPKPLPGAASDQFGNTSRSARDVSSEAVEPAGPLSLPHCRTVSYINRQGWFNGLAPDGAPPQRRVGSNRLAAAGSVPGRCPDTSRWTSFSPTAKVVNRLRGRATVTPTRMLINRSPMSSMRCPPRMQ